ncbi:hypothetical protein ACIOC2_25995 [Streptomyces sp. NPDC088337]|uniref:hypothetical protein n=1 Tax=unclassified Streptomyces TaxID=2593676 RepID=UPI002DDAFCE5|nr:hypothetical protein [Streptomyces sp. NBC_01788]WSB25121.1 hypothetical protein OIE49_04015 [Streptomyces sp. NBC_01788]
MTDGADPLGLRLLLFAVFVPVSAAVTAYFAVWAVDSGPGNSPGFGPLTTIAVVCGVLTLLAAIDLTVVVRRGRRMNPALRSLLDPLDLVQA